MKNPKWTQSENLEALKLFAQLKKSGVKPSAKDQRVLNLAVAIGREVSALMMRLGNYEYFYSNGLHGLKNGGKNLRLFYEATFPTL